MILNGGIRRNSFTKLCTYFLVVCIALSCTQYGTVYAQVQEKRTEGYVDGTTVETPILGTSYVFDFKNTESLQTGEAKSYGLMDLSGPLSYNSDHGMQVSNTTTLSLDVIGNNHIAIGHCTYNTPGTYFEVTTTGGTVGTLPTFPKAQTVDCYETSGVTYGFDYEASDDQVQTITIEFTGTYYIPIILVTPIGDEATEEESQKGGTMDYPQTDYMVTYDFADHSLDVSEDLVSDQQVDDVTSKDGFLELHANGASLYKHNSNHGLYATQGSTMDITVAGNAYIDFSLCAYGSGTLEVTKVPEGGLVSKRNINLFATEDGDMDGFVYKGEPGVITLTLTEGKSYYHAITVKNTIEDIDLVQWEKKDFTFQLGSDSFQVTGAEAEDGQASISGEGHTYFERAGSAYIYGVFDGITLSESNISYDENSIQMAEVEGNKVTFTFKDQSSYPYTFDVYFQDTSNYKTPAFNGVYTYDLGGTVVPKLFDKSIGIYSYTTDDGILTVRQGDGDSRPYWHDNAHGMAVYNKNEISIHVAGDATIFFELCVYSKEGTLLADGLSQEGTGNMANNHFKGESDGEVIAYSYKGEETVLTFTLDGLAGESYLHGIVVKNTGQSEGSDVVHEQQSMPVVVDEGGYLTATEMGHRLYVSHDNPDASITTMSGLSYYIFDGVAGAKRLEADVIVKAVGSSSNNGIFMALVEDATPITGIATIGARGNQSVRNVYTIHGASNSAKAGSINELYTVGERLHFVMEKRDTGWYTQVTHSDDTTDVALDYSKTSFMTDVNDSVRFGFVFSQVDAVIHNIMYYDENGKVLYDQRDAYEAIGEAPIIHSMNPARLSEDRRSIVLSWNGDTCADDASYLVEISKDGGKSYTQLSNQVIDKTYKVPVSEDGSYVFRVTGVCGDKQSNSMETTPVTVQLPLDTPTVYAQSNDGSIVLQFDPVNGATAYSIYRRSTEEQQFTKLAEVEATSYTDIEVTNETPYYYKVIALSDNNSSNPSEVLLTLPSAGHEGAFAYGDTAPEVTITKKSYDTVYDGKGYIKGIVGSAGTLTVWLNGQSVEEKTLNSQDKFEYELPLVEGRNSVELHYKDANTRLIGRKTLNFVYLTHYDLLVDQTVETNQQEGIYKTVQEAVDAVDVNNTQDVTILIRSGVYEEHLVVNTPNIHFIGEDRDQVSIEYYDPIESPEGGDTSKRCAVYIQSGAKGFTAENLTFKNNYEYLGDGSKSNESADALRVDADESIFVNVKLVGYQDTLDASANHQYYYQCYITGNVDFIYGSAQAVFEDCDLVFQYNGNKNSGYITAPRTSDKETYGYIFTNSRILAQEGCSGSKYLLARPWGPDGSATFIQTYMSGIINRTNPYSDMSGNLATEARFTEFYTYGEGFSINMNRPQISETQAQYMLLPATLGWEPYTLKEGTSALYNGDSRYAFEKGYVTYQYVDETTDPYSTKDDGLSAYDMEGFAAYRQVSGGGTLKENADHYYTAQTEKEFLRALLDAKQTGKDTVIELKADMHLGSLELGEAVMTQYKDVIKPANNQPLTHPTLLQTGVSTLMLYNMSNITIYSKEGYKILHTCMDISGSSDIIIRNIIFDELWEWDEGGVSSSGEVAKAGDYDRNDWDYITIQKGSTGIWIDHATFYKAYDGIVDIKKANPDDTMDVTISWSACLPESSNDFFDTMMTAIENHPENYPYYMQLMNEHKMTPEQIRGYASGQKKSHLVGASDSEANIENLHITLANNYYKDVMDRMPRLRGGIGHVYNTIIDATTMYQLKASLEDSYAMEKIVSNGVISTCDATVLIENSMITNVMKALLSGNGTSPGGYIAAANTRYIMDGKEEALTVTDSSGDGLSYSPETFKKNALYSDYVTYSPETLKDKVLPYVGAGQVLMSTTQWEKTFYIDTVNEPDEPGETPTKGHDKDKNKDKDKDNDSKQTHEGKDQVTDSNDETPEKVAFYVESAKKSFKDVDSVPWALKAIGKLSELGIFKGDDKGDFEPNATLIRGDFALLIARVFHYDVNEKEGVKYYDTALEQVYQQGIIRGDSTGNLEPEAEISRQDMMVMIYRALKVAGYVQDTTSETSLTGFDDMNEVSDYAKEAVTSLVHMGLVKGTGTSIEPNAKATRAETAVIIDRLLTTMEATK